MVDVELMLREYGQRLDKLCPEVTPDDVDDKVETTAAHVGAAPAVEPMTIDLPPSDQVPVMDLLTGANERTENVTRNRAIGGVLALAAVIALIVGGVLLVESDNDIETAQTPVTTSAPPTTPSEPVFGTAQALSVTDSYFAANTSGDFAALRALFVLDAAFTGPFTIAEAEQLFAWNVAQGTTVSPPECTAVDGAVAETMTVTCQTFNNDALVQAVDGPPVPIRLTLTITSEGIVEENGAFGQPNFNTVGQPFDNWMKENHPDDFQAVGFGKWTTIEEAEQNGTLTAQYAAEWAGYLEANGCEYDEGC